MLQVELRGRKQQVSFPPFGPVGSREGIRGGWYSLSREFHWGCVVPGDRAYETGSGPGTHHRTTLPYNMQSPVPKSLPKCCTESVPNVHAEVHLECAVRNVFAPQ